MKKSKLFPEKNFASKCSSRDREIGWRSGNLAEFFLTKSWSFFAQYTNMFQKLNCFQKEIFFASNVPLEELNPVSTVPTDFSWQKPKKMFTQYPELLEELIVFFRENIYFSSKSSYECSFENPAKNYSTNSWKFLPRNPNVIKRPWFSQKNSFFLNWSLGHVKCSFDGLAKFF